MDEDTRELTVRLATRAGMIMEDASLLAITMPADDDAAMVGALDRLTQETATVSQLISAAAALARIVGRTSRSSV